MATDQDDLRRDEEEVRYPDRSNQCEEVWVSFRQDLTARGGGRPGRAGRERAGVAMITFGVRVRGRGADLLDDECLAP